ncbi:MAG: DNA mismatch repair endonuclease MutL [Clostridia bacterium]|nr:DNA mismatch repair endonuclease MutL [Clostridia bacterium]
MGIINVLSPQMANLIAAGEVVERPGSVVKEIIENSIDAGATTIEVEIKNGGISYIRVSDNGKGIAPDDLPRAFLRHATSKIKEPDDMLSIATMGFRGEALAAISAVSRVDIFSRVKGELIGSQLSCEGGDMGELSETGCPEGTTIVIRDLFYNVPARMKFLKKDATEAGYCESAVMSAALAYPGIAFRFIKDGRESFFTTGSGQLLQVISALCGRETAGELLPAAGEYPGATISGFVSPPSLTRASRSMQYFLVNGRPVRGKILSAAVDGIYKGKVMPGRHPIVFLNINVPFSQVDVNVHPAKLEVKFSREKEVFSAIYNAIEGALEGKRGSFPQMSIGPEHEEAEPQEKPQEKPQAEEKKPVTAPKAVTATEGPAEYENALYIAEDTFKAEGGALSSAPPIYDAQEAAKKQEANDFDMDDDMFGISKHELVPRRTGPSPFRKSESYEPPEIIAIPAEEPVEIIEEEPQMPVETVQESITLPASHEEPEVAPESITEQQGRVTVIGMAFNTYILAQDDEGLWLIDKHAAHERIIYNRLRASIGSIDVQMLLRPVSVSLTPLEKQVCLDNMELLETCGFELSDLGMPGLAVRGAPVYIGERDIPFVLSEMAQKLTEGAKPGTSVLDDLLASISCKAAIKGGSRSDMRELQSLVDKVMSDPEVRNCPHGRPVAVFMTRQQLEKQFKRIL